MSHLLPFFTIYNTYFFFIIIIFVLYHTYFTICFYLFFFFYRSPTSAIYPISILLLIVHLILALNLVDSFSRSPYLHISPTGSKLLSCFSYFRQLLCLSLFLLTGVMMSFFPKC